MATGWILTELNPADIEPHPLNHAIYGSQIDDDLVADVEKFGVRQPIDVIKSNGKYVCLSGHRRRQSAQIAGLKTVPVRICRDDWSQAEQVIHLLKCNERQREKTTEMKARETEHLAEALKELAKQRMKAGKADPCLHVDKGRAIEQAAEKTGLGKKDTAAKAIEVVHEIDKATAAGDTEKAEELRETLNKKSVRAAHQKVKPPKEKKPAKPAKPSAERDTPCQSLAANVEWVIKQVVPRTQEFAIIAANQLGKRAGLFDPDAIKAACKTIFDEFSRIQKEVNNRAEAEKRCNSDQ